MGKSTFIGVLKVYGLDAEHVYEDVSELGKALWNNDKLSLGVVWTQDKPPCLEMVILRPAGGCSYFYCGLSEFDRSEIAQVVDFVRDNSERLYDAALVAGGVLAITIGNRSWFFKA